MTYNDEQLLLLQTKMIEVIFPHVRNLGKLNLSKVNQDIFCVRLMLRLALGCTNASVFLSIQPMNMRKNIGFFNFIEPMMDWRGSDFILVHIN